jgi:hypothetical protein
MNIFTSLGHAPELTLMKTYLMVVLGTRYVMVPWSKDAIVSFSEVGVNLPDRRGVTSLHTNQLVLENCSHTQKTAVHFYGLPLEFITKEGRRRL